MPRHIAPVLAAILLAAGSSPGADIPGNLVLDVRIFEARSTTPDFSRLQDLSFFIDTDGSGVSEEQWLATIARQVPETYLAVLAADTLEVRGTEARFRQELRSRAVELELDLSGFQPDETFEAPLDGRLTRDGDELVALERQLELRVGRTYVFSGRSLELSPSDYLSHFREYEDGEHRGRVYEYLRDYVFFLIVAVTPRLASAEELAEPVSVSLPGDAELPELASPAGVALVGTLVLEFDVRSDGSPEAVRILRSTIPEVTFRVLAELSRWRFPEAAGSRARLELSLRAES